MQYCLRVYGPMFFLLLGSAAAADNSFTAPSPVTVNSAGQATALTAATTSVYVDQHKLGGSAKEQQERFHQIMTALVDKPAIRHLKLWLPGSSSFKPESLDVLGEFKSLESLDMTDSRGRNAASVHEQVAAIKTLKHVKVVIQVTRSIGNRL